MCCNTVTYFCLVQGTVDPEAMLLLTNAVHFQESWTVAFEEVLEPIDFQLMNGGVSKVRMMKRVSYEIMTGIFKFEKVLPEMNMIIVTLRYSVNLFLMKNVLVFFYFSLSGFLICTIAHHYWCTFLLVFDSLTLLNTRLAYLMFILLQLLFLCDAYTDIIMKKLKLITK